MADYKAIKGYTIQSVSSDNAVLTVGDIWYNSTLGKLRVAKLAAGAWAAGGAINTARTTHGGAGTQTSALIFAGTPGVKDITESYDGSSWTEVANVNTARWGIGGTGITTAALAFAGQPPFTGKTEEFDGSSWTDVADIPQAHNYGLNSVGTQSSALTAGGQHPSIGQLDLTWEWDKSVGATSFDTT